MNIDLQIVRWPVELLIPRATNPRTHTARHKSPRLHGRSRSSDGPTRFWSVRTAISSPVTRA